jgi:uncharacterized protein YndB with AHSA1/START domain
MNTDRIERSIVLRAPQSRVWRAIATTEGFNAWFEVALTGNFTPGAKLSGYITSPGYEHILMEITVERVEPEQLMSYRWHPHAIDPNVDYSGEPTTLVEFHLAEQEGGTHLTIIESGFDQIPAERRDLAFRMNDSGWAEQLENIARYVQG